MGWLSRFFRTSKRLSLADVGATGAAREALRQRVVVDCSYGDLGPLIFEAIRAVESSGRTVSSPIAAVTESYSVSCARCKRVYDGEPASLLATGGLPQDPLVRDTVFLGPGAASGAMGSCMYCGGSRCFVRLDLIRIQLSNSKDGGS